MTLAVRLLLAFGLFAIFATAVVGVPLREVTRQSIEQDFAHRLEAAQSGVRRTLTLEVGRLQSSFPVCSNDMAIDKALMDLERAHGEIDHLDPGTRAALLHYGTAEAKNRQLDE